MCLFYLFAKCLQMILGTPSKQQDPLQIQLVEKKIQDQHWDVEIFQHHRQQQKTVKDLYYWKDNKDFQQLDEPRMKMNDSINPKEEINFKEQNAPSVKKNSSPNILKNITQKPSVSTKIEFSDKHSNRSQNKPILLIERTKESFDVQDENRYQQIQEQDLTLFLRMSLKFYAWLQKSYNHRNLFKPMVQVKVAQNNIKEIYQKDICVIITVHNSLLSIFKDDYIDLFDINIKQKTIALKTNMKKKVSFQDHLVKLIKDKPQLLRQQDMPKIWDEVFKRSLCQLISLFHKGKKINGYIAERVYYNFLGDSYFMVQYVIRDLQFLPAETIQELISQFCKIKSELVDVKQMKDIFKQDKMEMTKTSNCHCSTLHVKEGSSKQKQIIEKLPQNIDKTEIDFQKIRQTKILSLHLHLIVDKIKIKKIRQFAKKPDNLFDDISQRVTGVMKKSGIIYQTRQDKRKFFSQYTTAKKKVLDRSLTDQF